MSIYYNNIPQERTLNDSTKSTIQVFDAYSTAPFTVEAATFDAMVGFFEGRGFGEESAQSFSYIIIKQAYVDGHNPFQLIETLKGLADLELSGLITELLNYNRFKTSSLGTASPFSTFEEVARNIVV
jgi:hypothetical protein